MSIRLIAGAFRGRRLAVGRGARIRPTADRVREAMFAILDARDAVRDARVADLCAGAGSLGLEALSRGARRVVFVDSSRRSLEILRANASALGLAVSGPAAPVALVQADARAAVRRGMIGDAVDLVLADPPYGERQAGELLHLLGDSPALAPGARVALEHARAEVLPEAAGRLTRETERRFGDTVVDVYRVGEKTDDE